MPFSRASGDAGETDGLAVEDEFAAVRGVTPARIFISVDLPAPFSPTTASTSPACSASDTPVECLHAGELLSQAADFEEEEVRSLSFQWLNKSLSHLEVTSYRQP